VLPLSLSSLLDFPVLRPEIERNNSREDCHELLVRYITIDIPIDERSNKQDCDDRLYINQFSQFFSHVPSPPIGD
jgi:hypothetical protein